MPSIEILTTDCLEALRQVPDNSLDACVTDPPYGLSDHSEQDVRDCLKAWLNGESYRPKGKSGFMSKNWDAWCPGPEIWREVFRVLKPGAYLACFASTRTADLMSMAIRLAGFRKQSDFAWCHGQGFPKATNVSKMIDREQGGVRKVVRQRNQRFGLTQAAGWNETSTPRNATIQDTVPATEAAKRWDDFFYGGQAIKPSHEPILLFQKPHEGRPVDSILRWGCGALNVGACRIGLEENCRLLKGGTYGGNRGSDKGTSIFGTNTRGLDYEVPSQSGRWPATILLGHVADAPCPVCNPNELESVERPEDCPACGGGGWVLGCRRVGTKRVQVAWSQPMERTTSDPGMFKGKKQDRPVGHADPDGLETVDNWECVEGCPCGMFPETGKSTGGQCAHVGMHKMRGDIKPTWAGDPGYGDSGSAARFFYQAKASRRERAFYCRDCQDAFWSKDREAHLHPEIQPMQLRSKLTPEEREFVLSELSRRGFELKQIEDDS